MTWTTDAGKLIDKALTAPTLTDADRTMLVAILRAPDGATIEPMIRAYYRDADRADRTPREFLYLHLGLLSGVIDRLREASALRQLADEADEQHRRTH